MALVYKDRVKETTTTTGTGTLTLAGAATGYQAFSTVGDGNTCIYALEDANGTAWEVGIGTYTLSGTTLARTTILASSASGSAITLSAGTHSVFLTADSSALRNGFLRSAAASPTTAGVTGEVGTMHMLDISGLTASRDFTLPATAAVGDKVGVTITAGYDTYALLLKPATGDTINGGSAGAEWSRLFIRGETVIFRCSTADSAWEVEIDGRIPCSAVLTLASDSDSTTTNTWQIPTSTSTAGSWTENRDIGGCMDHTIGKFTCRRAGTYQSLGRASSNVAPGDGVRWAAMVHKNNTTTVAIATTVHGAASQIVQSTYGGMYALDVTDYVELKWLQGAASLGMNTDSTFTVQEIL
jgi:hypothetical protein